MTYRLKSITTSDKTEPGVEIIEELYLLVHFPKAFSADFLFHFCLFLIINLCGFHIIHHNLIHFHDPCTHLLSLQCPPNTQPHTTYVPAVQVWPSHSRLELPYQSLIKKKRHRHIYKTI